MSTPPPDGVIDPADLGELAATDALLDRLGARAASEDDLNDPLNLAWADLLAAVDEIRTPDVGLARLLDVLDGRPLYVLCEQDGEISQLADPAVAADLESLLTRRDPDRPLTIDLTDRVVADGRLGIELSDQATRHRSAPGTAASVPGEQRDGHDHDLHELKNDLHGLKDDQDADDQGLLAELDVLDEYDVLGEYEAGTAADDVAGEGRRVGAAASRLADVLPLAPLRRGRRRTAGSDSALGQQLRPWERALSQVSLPAASVILILALGGVSVAVTGNPMAPIDGVSNVVAQIPGVETAGERTRNRMVEAQISAAKNAVMTNQPQAAKEYIQEARKQVKKISGEKKVEYLAQIEVEWTKVSQALGAQQETPADAADPGDVTPTPAVTAAPSPDPEPTPEPSIDPEPTDQPSASITVGPDDGPDAGAGDQEPPNPDTAGP